MTEDLISIIMSSYNSEKTIKKSILSILNQDYKNIEFLIVDDCSTDKSLSIMKKLAKNDKRIKIIENKKNIGLTKSLNKLLRISKGKYIARQDADDVSFPHRLSTQVNFLKKTNSEIITSRAVIKDKWVKIPRYSHLFPTKLVIKYKNPFIHGTLFVNKNVFEEVGGYDENFYFAQDYKFYLDCYNFGKKIKIINDVLYELNDKNNISNKHKKEQEYYFNCARKNIIPNSLKTDA
tara:strand:+ start:2119 stop:2823 length:705 start_codon:yes stop_codon:yes gene_type:complete